jgi:DNA polymerase-3 subunit delta'
MTHGAQNAFLKLLEEPRDDLHFIIATHRFDQLLPTIASRSQRLALQSVTDEQTAALIGQLGVTDDTKRARMAFVGRGLPALIHRLVEDDKLYENRVAIMRDAKALLGNDAYEKMTVIHRYRDSRANALTLLDDMNHQLRTVLRSNPDKRLVGGIERNLEVRARISAGGNIRLHLTTAVL